MLAYRLHRALAWASPVLLGFLLAYLFVFEPWPTVVVAAGVAAAAGVVVFVVRDFQHLQAMRRWAALLVEYRDAAVDAGHETTRARVYRELVRDAVLDLHRSAWPAVQGDDGAVLSPEVVNYAVAHSTSMPEAHECITELVHVESYGWMRCDPVAGVHVIEACQVCGTEWPCATVQLVDPRTCRYCGCTDLMGCEGGCRWVADDVCSACAVEFTIEVDTTAFTAAMESVAASVVATNTEVRAIADAIEAFGADRDAGAAEPGLLVALGVLLVDAALAVSVAIDAPPALDGRGILATALAVALLAGYAARRRTVRADR